CVREQVLHDGALGGGFFRIEECDAGLPAVFEAEVVGLAASALADDDLEAVVAHVERLPAALDAIAEYGDGFILEDLPDLVRRVVRPLDALFDVGADLDLFHREEPRGEKSQEMLY